MEVSRKGAGVWVESQSPSWDWDRCDYRLKPEPKTRLKRLDEIPSTSIVRRVGHSDLLIAGFSKSGDYVLLNNEWVSVEYLANIDATYTTDPLRKTWHPFTVEVYE